MIKSNKNTYMYHKQTNCCLLILVIIIIINNDIFHELMENVTVFETVDGLFCLVSTCLSTPFGLAEKNSFGSRVLAFDSKNKLATIATNTVVAKPMTM